MALGVGISTLRSITYIVIITQRAIFVTFILVVSVIDRAKSVKDGWELFGEVLRKI